MENNRRKSRKPYSSTLAVKICRGLTQTKEDHMTSTYLVILYLFLKKVGGAHPSGITRYRFSIVTAPLSVDAVMDSWFKS